MGDIDGDGRDVGGRTINPDRRVGKGGARETTVNGADTGNERAERHAGVKVARVLSTGHRPPSHIPASCRASVYFFNSTAHFARSSKNLNHG
jgi:hypothetical protein